MLIIDNEREFIASGKIFYLKKIDTLKIDQLYKSLMEFQAKQASGKHYVPVTINDTPNKERKGEILSTFEQLTGQKGRRLVK